jgi:hypothetical protein
MEQGRSDSRSSLGSLALRNAWLIIVFGLLLVLVLVLIYAISMLPGCCYL